MKPNWKAASKAVAVAKKKEETLLKRQLRASLKKEAAVVAQVGGDHYAKTGGLCPHCGSPIQHWDLVARHPYLEAQISKYIVRWQEKGREEDLDKAQSYLTKLRAFLRLEAENRASGGVRKGRKTTPGRA
jgi:hypothetical protein